MGIKLVVIDLAGEQITKISVLDDGSFRTAAPSEYSDLLPPPPIDLHLRITELTESDDHSLLSADRTEA